MGYKPKRKLYEIVIVEFPGLEVTCKSTPLGKLLDLTKEFGNLKVDDMANDVEKQKRVFGFFAKQIITWNVEHPDLDDDDSVFELEKSSEPTCKRCGLSPGQLMPTEMEYMLCLEMQFIMAIIFGWVTAVASASNPKGMNLSNGAGTSQKDLMQMLAEMQSPVT